MADKTLGPYDILRICGVPDHPRLFHLPTVERPSRILSQQRRALNLIHALFESHAIRNRGICIIGGGFGGLTAATYAALQGARVHVLEKEPDVLWRFRGSQRFIHPRMYDWPEAGWDIPTAGLPVLNWKAGSAESVVESLSPQLAVSRSQFGLRLEKRVTVEAIEGDQSAAWVRYRRADGALVKDEFDVAIIALGFGDERVPAKAFANEFQGYWRLTAPPAPYPSLSGVTLHVVGNGDGALADLVGLGLLSTTGSVEGFLGDFTKPLELLKDVRGRIAELEHTARRRVVTGHTAFTQDYADSMRSLLALVPDGLRRVPVNAVRMRLTKDGHYLDLPGTYSANRALFLALYADKINSEPRRPKRGRQAIGTEIKLEPPPPPPAGTSLGPFAIRSPKHWVLQRLGPHDPLQVSFPVLAAATLSSQSRNKLELSERPISAAAWSQRARWEECVNDRHLRLLPRLSLSTELVDPPIQRMMAQLNKSRAPRFLAAMLRLHVLLFDEVCLTDASIFDGAVVPDAVRMLTHEELLAHTVMVRKPTLMESLVSYLAVKGPSDKWRGKEVELSVLNGRMSPAGGKSFRADTTDAALRQLRKHGLGWIIDRVVELESLAPWRLRDMPGGAILSSVSPQFGLLEHLGAVGVREIGILPQRTDHVAPSRTTVFANLKQISRSKGNLFMTDRPAWLPTMLSWYNAAYNTTIARKNGCTACEVLWIESLLQSSPSNIALDSLVSVKIDDLLNNDARMGIRDRLSNAVRDWHRGVRPLVDVLRLLPNAVAASPWPKVLPTVRERLRAALVADSLVIGELRNTTAEAMSPDRAILIGTSEGLVTTILVGE